jgi:hypothetical protein
MQRSTSRPIRIALALAGALALGACSSDGGDSSDGDGSGSTETFCEEIATLADFDEDSTEEEDFAAIRAIADVAPDEISDEMDLLVDVFDEFQSFDPATSSEEELAEFLELADTIDEAGTSVEEFTVENCPDLPDGVFNPR